MISTINLSDEQLLQAFRNAPNYCDFNKVKVANLPSVFAEESLGIHLSPKQVSAIDAIKEHRWVMVQSFHQRGKTMLSAILATWWLLYHPESTIAITLTPTYSQTLILWQYIQQYACKLNLLTSKTRWHIASDRFASGLSVTQLEKYPLALQGYCAHNLLVVLDEVGTIPEAYIEMAKSLTVFGNCRIFATNDSLLTDYV